jgi:hypothetical protein
LVEWTKVENRSKVACLLGNCEEAGTKTIRAWMDFLYRSFGEQGQNFLFDGGSFLYICGSGSWLWWPCLERRGMCKGNAKSGTDYVSHPILVAELLPCSSK